MPTNAELVSRLLLGFVLAYAIGFERELRGASAGDRTFSLIGLGTTAITAVALRSSPQAVAGAVTGIGFIGAGVVFHGPSDMVKGLTTAAAIFATAAIGVVVGSGHLLLGLLTGALVLLAMELRFVPGLDVLDGRRYQGRVRDDSKSVPPQPPPPAPPAPPA